MDLATVMDRLTIDELITSYAVAVDDADWSAYRALFTQEGRADYRSSGGVEGPAAEVADWMAETMRLFPVRQHLIVNRRLHIQDLGGYPGDRAEVQADYVNPMRLESGDDLVSGGRYTFSLLRTDAGWRLRTVVIHEKWRRGAGAGGPSGD
ncbi:hypothetical protein SLUN_05910 [Streptomyces lunaelactis]|uniref:SnoaL-like domain-containing protein n=1 Tax=Streptomyces lunaelactis TaxID=1535768 RepID=A0A2R4TDS5_9ACTN|nr:hypothetical protein SLUN_05910 [Streptomyces lunaelactis]